MVLDGETPVCAGFVYITNSKVAWCEFIISNPNYKNHRKGDRDWETKCTKKLNSISRSVGYK